MLPKISGSLDSIAINLRDRVDNEIPIELYKLKEILRGEVRFYTAILSNAELYIHDYGSIPLGT